MRSNRKFIDFRELLLDEIIDGGQIVVIPSCGNMRKVEFLINSPKVNDPSKILMYIEVNDIDNQYPKDIIKNFVIVARKFQEKLE